MLASVLGYSACGEELCLPLVLWCLAWEAEITLASVLGCSACGEDLCKVAWNEFMRYFFALLLWCLA